MVYLVTSNKKKFFNSSLSWWLDFGGWMATHMNPESRPSAEVQMAESHLSSRQRAQLCFLGSQWLLQSPSYLQASWQETEALPIEEENISYRCFCLCCH